MIGKLVDWLIIGTIVLLCLWGIGLYGEIFRAHMSVFLFLWVFLPALAFWFGSRDLIHRFSLTGLILLRKALTWAVISISFAALAHYDYIRDAIGHQFVEGYDVSYYEDSDDYGRPVAVSSVTTAHWYARFGFWLFEWIFLLNCVTLPYLSWRGASRAVEAARHEVRDNARE